MADLTHSAFPIPDEALAQHTAVLGKTGSGKTSTSKLLIEHVVAEDYRVCILDPIKSDWWGITSSADGKSPGLPFTILGGPRGPVSLPPTSGKAIGQLVGTGKLPLSILDMADFEAGDLQRFFGDFAAALMRHMRGVLYLVVEEAHEFAPKERAGFGAENQSIHWAKKLATAGRSKGIRLIVATQRVQSLHNAVLGSCETLIAHRLTTPADQEPVLKWMKANANKADQEAIAGSISSLPTGTGWVCSGEARLFERAAFPKFATFDNTATPDRDGDEQSVVTATVDEEGLRAILGDAVKEAASNDPKALKGEVARLTRELAKAERSIAAPPAPVTITANADEVAAARAEGQRVGISIGITRAQQAISAIRVEPSDDNSWKELAPIFTRPRRAAPTREPAKPIETDSSVPAGCAKPLAALACVYPSGLTEAQWATAAGYKRTGGTWGTYKSRLRGAGLIETREGRWFATGQGASAVGDVEMPPPAGPDLVRWWASRLPGTTKVAEALIAAHPHALSKDDLAFAVEMSAAGGSFGTYLSRLAGADLITRDGGMIALSSAVMPA
jgi:hypothetical protein